MLAAAVVLASAMFLAFLTFAMVWRARRLVPYTPSPALRARSASPYRTPGRKSPARGF